MVPLNPFYAFCRNVYHWMLFHCHVPQSLNWGSPIKRPFPSYQMKHTASKRPYISLRWVWIIFYYFWSHIPRCPYESSFSHAVWTCLLWYSKVANFYSLFVIGQENVARFKVSMDYVVEVKVRKSKENLFYVALELRSVIHSTALVFIFDVLFKWSSLHVLHHDTKFKRVLHTFLLWFINTKILNYLLMIQSLKHQKLFFNSTEKFLSIVIPFCQLIHFQGHNLLNIL